MSKVDKSKNNAQIAKGKIKEVTGRAAGDDELEVDGKIDQVKGHLKQAGEKAKDALKK